MYLGYVCVDMHARETAHYLLHILPAKFFNLIKCHPEDCNEFKSSLSEKKI